MSLISLTLLLPLVGVFFLLFTPSWKFQLIRNIALNFSLLTFLISLLLWIEFDNSTAKFQFVENYTTFPNSTGELSFSTLNLILGIDGISLFFIILLLF